MPRFNEWGGRERQVGARASSQNSEPAAWVYKTRVGGDTHHRLWITHRPSASTTSPGTLSNMSMTDVIPAADIAKAINAFKAVDSFNHKKFFEILGLKKRSLDDVKKVFNILDADCSGFMELDEVKCMMQGFSKEGRTLSDEEAKILLVAGDKDGDGKIGVDEFTSLVAES
ncbi:hypothetical protein NDU88_005538 [Pleurodeles waltl]|uniref:Parvalbumin n=2 Tax=Pleurodeles waltl TaxID=8319 RepID=A0AAV7TB29_PLEWA|nr:hypothetical protein NDU88_005538 [Pleurodeles waltl]